MPELVVDLAQLNTELLSNPVAIGGHPQVRRLAEQDPSLGFLCPLARALFKFENGCCDAAEAEAAMGSCWLVDYSAVHMPEDWKPGDNVAVVETVEHRIDTAFQGRPVILCFRSEADLLYCSEEFKTHITAATAADLLAEQGDLRSLANPGALVKWVAKHDGDPVAYPEGENEPLCSIRYQLCAIDGIAINGPALINGYHDISLEDLNEDYEQRPDEEIFCWLHSLDEVQAKKLGFALSKPRFTRDASDEEHQLRYPSWVPVDADLEGCWINAEKLQASYDKGQRMRTGAAPISLELGSGLDWDPRHDSEQFPNEIEEGG